MLTDREIGTRFLQFEVLVVDIKTYRFFNSNDPEFLQILWIDSDEYIGKSTESGASFEKLNNLVLNVKTMLKMITPKFSLDQNALKIYAYTPVHESNYY